MCMTPSPQPPPACQHTFRNLLAIGRQACRECFKLADCGQASPTGRGVWSLICESIFIIFSTLNSPLSMFHFQLSILHFPFSIFNFQLSIFNFPFSTFHFQLSMSSLHDNNHLIRTIFLISVKSPASIL